MNNKNNKVDNTNLNSLKNLSILLIDDDILVLEDVCSTIKIFCNNVYTAVNGKDALKIIDKYEIDMIITDYVMPQMDGYEFCKNVRNIDIDIPITLASNYSDRDKLLKMIPLNLTEYLIKPISYLRLTQSLHKMIQKREERSSVNEKIGEEIEYNYSSKTLKNKDKLISLTKYETLILELFIKNKNSLVEYHLIENIISDSVLTQQALKNLIYRLRIKIGKDFIINVKDMGYMLVSK